MEGNSELNELFRVCVKKHLAASGMNQTELAAKADVSPSTISEILKGRKFYSSATWSKIAAAFGKTLIDLLECGDAESRPECSNAVGKCCRILAEIEELDPIEFGRIYGRLETILEYLRDNEAWTGQDRRNGTDRRANNR